MPPKLGIVAGGGALPGYVARSALEQGREVVILALENQADQSVVAPFEHAWVRMGAAGKAIAYFRDKNVAEVVMAGPVERPGLMDLRPDGRALKFLSKGALKRGDDGVLSAIVAALEEEEGFRVLDVREIAGGITAREGAMTSRSATEQECEDVERGIAVLRALGHSDVGQAVVVQDGVILGVEAIEGTDGLIDRCRLLRRDGHGPVLVKMTKPGQENRVDLPTIGPDTVKGCVEAGFAGIALEASMCLVIDEDVVVSKANAAGLFVQGWPTQVY
ncbi:MAG: UDP-2,3-diacylglucosamine pyrophosphatase [Rhodospirillaceae bacterium]|nr:UDP-2,3-diacylglucosamine pyrophosphatase [Rhodospirillaceae bacterium]|tara:strand:- start:865 stop:1689 length:825 start_codon:yes stop_codon:yes gene_type:complete